MNLREAAEAAGTSKSSIFRAIKSGRLSCTRDGQGGIEIDPSELARVYPPRPPIPLEPDRFVPAEHRETDEIRMRNAALEVEVKLLREMADAMRAERDRWAAIAERLTIAAPIIPPPVAVTAPARWWWRRAS